jgi:hypothetical protein
MTPDVEAAITELKQIFDGHTIDITPEAQGGAYIKVHDLDIGQQFTPSRTWVGFLINFQYPRSDVYPHFMEPTVRYADGSHWRDGISGPMDWNGTQAIQISRRSNRWDASRDTAVIKLVKVLEWLRKQ